ncbi:MAG: hypothetical protein K0Q79_3146 [Flavipsychrobacter sp.]|jgi:hypothetical protein|nr:hypothetical protein [Flavipsychrobacter sp.]
MQKTLLLLMLTCLVTFTAIGQGIKTVALKQERIAFAPVNYYIANVTDDRKDKNSIGKISKDVLNLQGGASAAIKNFIDKGVIQNTSRQAISIHITQLDFNIKKQSYSWKTDAEVTLAFYVNDQKLIELNSKGQKEADGDPLEYVDEFIKKAIESDLKRFDTWWAQNRGKIPTMPTVEVTVNIGRTINKPNTIVYSTARPLSVADFEATPQEGGLEQAATLSGSGFQTAADVRNGQVVVNVTITPYFDRAGSWFKKGGHTQAVLAHEQAHFDITALTTCELANRIRNTTFQKTTYEQKLDEMLKESREEGRKEQARFDQETEHGTLRDKELEWEKSVRDKIATCGCY